MTMLRWLSCARPRRQVARPEAGASLVEAMVVLLIAGIFLAGSALAARRMIRRTEAPAASRRLASEIRLRRSQAVATAHAFGMLFDEVGGAWRVSIYEDGDGDGIQTADIQSGVDPLRDGPQAFAVRYGGARPGFHPSLLTLSSPPPSSQPLGSLDDPIRFGARDLIVFSPRGTGSSGTVYMTDGRERQLALVVFGPTGRLRTWEYDLGRRRWIQR